MKDYRQTELFPMEEELTLSVEDTHVSRFPLPDIKKAKRIKDTSGRNILGSLENSVRITQLERTWADIFDSVWIPYSKTWTAKTTPLGALVLKQRVSVPPTAGNGSSGSQQTWPTLTQDSASNRTKKYKQGGTPLTVAVQEKLWATPSAMDHLPQRSAEATLRLQEGQRKGRSRPSNLREQVDPETMRLWPTPQAMDGMRSGQIRKREELSEAAKKGGCSNLREAVHDPKYQEMWPTIVAHEGRLGYQRRDTGKKGTQKSLTTIVVDKEGGRKATKLHLNPTWVEALMGFPPGWTVLGNGESQE